MRGYLAAEGYERQLESELGPILRRCGRLLFAEPPAKDPYWAINVWENPQIVPIRSIGDAVKQLRAIQRDWVAFPWVEPARMALISQQLSQHPFKPILFPAEPAKHPVGSWTLLDRDTLLFASRCSSPFPNGEPNFVAPAVGPPSQAYLKLWEALSLLGHIPQEGERCLELGASPGGWTWALSQLGAQVLAVDRSPLDPAVEKMAGVSFESANAFAMTPERVGKINWLFSDVICYPEKLLEFVRRWLDSGCCQRFVCTLKFQGADGYDVADAFAAIPGSQVVHLFHNKHELTWIL